MAQARILGKNKKMGNNLETKKGETIMFVDDMCPVLLHIPIKLHEDIPKKGGAIILMHDTLS